MSVLSIQSHVTYGSVGNSAAIYPLQALGHDVHPVHTVQFSNHTEYKRYGGSVSDSNVIRDILNAFYLNQFHLECKGAVSGYMGTSGICEVWMEFMQKIHTDSKGGRLLYLCDPVIGDKSSGIYVESGVVSFFKEHLFDLQPNIITPNLFEAELLSGIKYRCYDDLKEICAYFHDNGINEVVVTSVENVDSDNSIKGNCISIAGSGEVLVKYTDVPCAVEFKGTGDLFAALYLGYCINKEESEDLSARASVLSDVTRLVRDVVEYSVQAGKRELCILNVGRQICE